MFAGGTPSQREFCNGCDGSLLFDPLPDKKLYELRVDVLIKAQCSLCCPLICTSRMRCGAAAGSFVTRSFSLPPAWGKKMLSIMNQAVAALHPTEALPAMMQALRAFTVKIQGETSDKAVLALETVLPSLMCLYASSSQTRSSCCIPCLPDFSTRRVRLSWNSLGDHTVHNHDATHATLGLDGLTVKRGPPSSTSVMPKTQVSGTGAHASTSAKGPSSNAAAPVDTRSEKSPTNPTATLTLPAKKETATTMSWERLRAWAVGSQPFLVPETPSGKGLGPMTSIAEADVNGEVTEPSSPRRELRAIALAQEGTTKAAPYEEVVRCLERVEPGSEGAYEAELTVRACRQTWSETPRIAAHELPSFEAFTLSAESELKTGPSSPSMEMEGAHWRKAGSKGRPLKEVSEVLAALPERGPTPETAIADIKEWLPPELQRALEFVEAGGGGGKDLFAEEGEILNPGRLDRGGMGEFPSGTTETMAGASRVGEYVVLNGKMPDGEVGAIGAIRIADVPGDVEVQANCIQNLRHAYRKRFVEKTRPVTATKDDKERLQACANYIKDEIITEDAIFNALGVLTDLRAMKSKKWSPERFEKGITNLLAKVDPKITFKMAIKNEVAPVAGKAPRFLIADGDPGQIMALAAVGILEHILFHAYEKMSIKHCEKGKAIDRIVKELQRHGGPPVMLVEGDGSAWDTTCSLAVRAICENDILAKISKILTRVGFAPQAWLDAHEKAGASKTTSVSAQAKGLSKSFHRAFFDAITSIRRSGHRGTSVLNYLVNITLWASALGEGTAFLDPTKFKYKCRYTGEVRRRFMACEGDDSILRLELALAAHMAEVEAYWERWGFNMKIFQRNGTVAEFCGWHLDTVADGGTTGEACPDVARAFAKLGWSASPSLVAAMRCNNWKKVKSDLKGVAKATFISLAYANAGRNDPLANFALALAEGCGVPAIFEHNHVMAMGLDGKKVEEEAIVARIRGMSSRACPVVPKSIMDKQGLSYTEEFNIASFTESLPWQSHFGDLITKVGVDAAN